MTPPPAINGAQERVDLLLVLSHVILVRNFVADGLLGAMIGGGWRIAVVAPDDVLTMIRELAPGLVALYPLSEFRCSKRRNRTMRWLRLGSFYARRDRAAYALKLAFSSKVTMDTRLVLAFWRLAARWTDPERLAGRWAARLRPRASSVRLIRALDPRMVLWPTTISDPSDVDIVQAAVRHGVRLVMCEGSWDNLVTKGAIWPRPDHLLVWGEFSRDHAMSEHGFARQQVDVTGPPHFGVYSRPEALMPRAEWFARHGLDPSRRLILVAGSTIGQRVEPELLRSLSALVANGELPPSYVWYRPHPKVGRRFDATPFAADPHVRIDPSLEAGDAAGGMNRLIHADEARQRADGLAACDAIVSMFSTVVLEGALLGKPAVLVDLRMLKGVSQRPTTSFQGVTHVQFMLQTPWIRLAPSLESLAPVLREFLDMDPEEVGAPLREFAQQVASCGPRTPHERTIGAIARLLAEPTRPEAHAS